MAPLQLFPPNGLDRSLHAPILVGLAVTTFFTEAYGWTYAGLVVPGYLAAIASLSPYTALLITAEALLTYALVASVGIWLPRSGAWSTTFGRERFFLFIVAAVLVRLGVEGWVVPHVFVAHGIPHARELYSVGLVIIPLYANVFWNMGAMASLPRLVVTSAITYAVVDLVFRRYTNFSLSRLLIASESGAEAFVTSPKAQLILLLGAMLGARGNVLYGWDYNGILVPALLGVAWYQPSKLLSSFVEALVVYGVARGLAALPPLNRTLLVGTRRTLLVYVSGFALKMLLGFAVAHWAPRVQLVDFLGFGYLLPSLLAVKMWNKDKIGIVLVPTLQVSLMAFLAGNGAGYALAALGGPLEAKAAVEAEPPHRIDDAAWALTMGDSTPLDARRESTETTLDVVASVLRDVRDGEVLTESTRRLATARKMELSTSERWVVLTPSLADPFASGAGARLAVRSPYAPSRKWIVTAERAAPGGPLAPLAMAVAEQLDAAAIVLVSPDPALARADEETILEVRKVLAASHRASVAMSEGASQLTAHGLVPLGVDLRALTRRVGLASETPWTKGGVSDAKIELALSRTQVEEAAAARWRAAAVEVHDEAPEQLMVRRSGELTRVAEGAFLPTSAPEVRIAGAILAPWLFDGAYREPSPFERAVATRLGYTLLRLDGGWGMAELGTARRGLPTIVARESASPSALALVAPAPQWEHGIVEASASLARALDPHLVLYAGAMPKAHPLGYADERHGHVGPSVLQRIAELWLADGGHTMAVRAMLPDIAPEDLETVLSLGTELSSEAQLPPWIAAPWRGLAASGLRGRLYDGTPAMVPFAAHGAPLVKHAETFAPGMHATLWLHPSLRERFVRSLPRRDALVASRLQGGDEPDVAGSMLRSLVCRADDCPSAGVSAACALEDATAAWVRFTRERNVALLGALLDNPACQTRVVRERATGRRWALLRGREGSRLVPLTATDPARRARPVDEASLRRAVGLGLSIVEMEVTR